MSEPETATLKQGTVLDDKWIIMELIGKGAMGEVYRAHQTKLKRDVAIKIISEAVIAEIEDDPEELDIAFGRFQREVQTMARVRHANILAIYDYGEVVDEENPESLRSAYIAMEYIPGDSLRFTLPEDGRDDLPEEYGAWVMHYFMPILEGVEVLHNNKIVHRDLKPENIFLDGDIPKIGDFGLARSLQMKAVTSSIEMLGTLAYMSPEQCADFKTAEFTADIYALGKILFEAVHGTLTEKVLPFTSVSIINPQGDFLTEMSEVIRKATLEKAEDRYQTVAELRGALQNALCMLEKDDTDNSGSKSTAAYSGFFSSRRTIWLSLGIAVAIISVLLMSIYHLAGDRGPWAGLDDSSYSGHAEISNGQQIVLTEDSGPLEKNIIGNDGSRMILIGDISNRKGKLLFYMDEEKVTNFLFLEFLNSMVDKLSVKSGVVRFGETIIIYIGSESDKDNAIVYKHDRFHLKDQNDGIKPVVRVTYHGAHLYAISYEKDLLSEEEWRVGYEYQTAGRELENKAANKPGIQTTTNMMHDFPSRPEEENELSVLDGMEINLKEWVRINQRAGIEDTIRNDGEVFASGVLDVDRLNDGANPLKRFPWEGFADVGFRTKTIVVRK